MAVTLQTGIEAASCAPSVVVAGFAQCASSFLFSALTAHPLLLPPLRGPRYKEPHCYSYESAAAAGVGGGNDGYMQLRYRPWCYPLVEAGEPFLTADGSAAYSGDPNVPFALKQVRSVCVYS